MPKCHLCGAAARGVHSRWNPLLGPGTVLRLQQPLGPPPFRQGPGHDCADFRQAVLPHRSIHPRCSFTFSLHQPLAPRIRWSQWGDHVAVSVWGGFRVDVLEDNRLVRSIRWAGVGENRLSRSEAVALLEAQGYLGACDDGLAETIEKHGFHPQPQIVRGLAVAPDERLWVQVNTVEGVRILLLDTEGYMVGVLPEGFPMPLTFLPDGRPLVQVVDSLDVERIGVGSVVKH